MQDLNQRIEKALNEIRPYLENDGGNISLVDITNKNEVKVKLHGACIDCKVNQMTLKMGVEQIIKKYAPEIVSVIKI